MCRKHTVCVCVCAIGSLDKGSSSSSSSPEFHAHTHTLTHHLWASAAGCPPLAITFIHRLWPGTVTLGVGAHTDSHSHKRAHTLQTCWMLILGFCLCSFGSDSGPDPFLHSGNPPKCTLMAAWSLGPARPCRSRSHRRARTHTRTHWCAGIKL